MPQMPFWEFLIRLIRMARSSELDLESRAQPFLKYGDIYKSPTSVLVCDPELVKQIISQNWPKVSIGGLKNSVLFKYLMGESLVAVSGEQWKNQKRLVGPAFHHEQLGHLFTSVFRPVAGRLVGILQDLCATGAVEWDAQEAMSRVTIDVIGLGAFGHDFGALEGRASAARTALVEGLGLAASPLLFVLPSFFKLPTESNTRLRRHLASLDTLVADLLAQKRERSGSAGRADLLDLILAGCEGEDGLSDRELHDNIFTFFLAGHETSAVTLSMALYNLALHQDWQRRLREEVCEVLGDTSPGDATAEALQGLPTCTAVLKETLRMYPPAGGITPRVAPKDVTLGGYHLPAGTSVSISIYALHHHKGYWERPHDFNPERFMRSSAPHHPYAWMPFSAGSRVCIGMNFAWMEMRIVLAELVRSFEWTLKPDHHLKFERYITLRPSGGVPLIVKAIKSGAS